MRKTLATSATIGGIKKMISNYFYGSTIELRNYPQMKYVWEIYNSNGLIVGFEVEYKRDRYRFISI